MRERRGPPAGAGGEAEARRPSEAWLLAVVFGLAAAELLLALAWLLAWPPA
jgi:hypothetical protein